MSFMDLRGVDALRFRWLGSGRVPAGFDLRRCGWVLDDRHGPSRECMGPECVGPECVGIVDGGDLDGPDWMRMLASHSVEMRRFALVVGVRRAHERAMLLQVGFGDAVTDAVDIEELGARAGRIAELTHWLPRRRDLGGLQLDLLAREAYANGKPLNLNPREFSLLWRLAESPNRAVSKQMLIYDVWRLGFVPETNSIAVHMSRLRRKLTFVGLRGVIETAPEGGYCLRMDDEHNGREAFTVENPRPAAPPASTSAAGHAVL